MGSSPAPVTHGSGKKAEVDSCDFAELGRVFLALSSPIGQQTRIKLLPGAGHCAGTLKTQMEQHISALEGSFSRAQGGLTQA